MKLNKYILIVSAIFLLFSCNGRPRNVLPKDKMINLLIDIQLTHSVTHISGDTTYLKHKDALLRGVFEKHRTTQTQLDSSLHWYSDNIKEYNEINDTIISRLNVKITSLNKQKDKELMANQEYATYDIMPKYLFLNADQHLFSFRASAPKIIALGWDKFHWEFSVQGLREGQNLKAGIFYKYADTVVSFVKTIDKNTAYKFEKPIFESDSLNRLAPDITGYIRLQNFKIEDLTKISVYNMSYLVYSEPIEDGLTEYSKAKIDSPNSN